MTGSEGKGELLHKKRISSIAYKILCVQYSHPINSDNRISLSALPKYFLANTNELIKRYSTRNKNQQNVQTQSTNSHQVFRSQPQTVQS